MPSGGLDRNGHDGSLRLHRWLILGKGHSQAVRIEWPAACPWIVPGSDQLADRVSAVEQEVGAVGGVVDHGVLDVDAELVIERGEDILIMHGPILRFLAQAVGRTDDLAHAHAAAGQEGARRPGPVVSAGGFVDARGAAEFAPGDDADILVEPAGVQIFDQGGDSLIELVELRGELGEVAAVPVPTAERERDATGARFDQTPGQQELVHPVRAGVFAEGGGGTAAAVAIAEPRDLRVRGRAPRPVCWR